MTASRIGTCRTGQFQPGVSYCEIAACLVGRQRSLRWYWWILLFTYTERFQLLVSDGLVQTTCRRSFPSWELKQQTSKAFTAVPGRFGERMKSREIIWGVCYIWSIYSCKRLSDSLASPVIYQNVAPTEKGINTTLSFCVAKCRAPNVCFCGLLWSVERLFWLWWNYAWDEPGPMTLIKLNKMKGLGGKKSSIST